MANNCQVPTPPQYVNELLDYIGYSVDLYNKSVLENSCGEGNILKEVVRRYINSSLENGYSNEQIIHGLENHIIGYDTDPICVKKCKETLDFIAQEYGLSGISWNVFEQDYLKCKQGSYDFIIGNPPYITYHDLSEEQRTFVKENFATCKKGRFDYCYAFIEAGIRDLSKKGKLAYLIPYGVIRNKHADKVRDLIKKNLKGIIDYKGMQLFPNTVTSSIIILCDTVNREDIDYYVRKDEVKKKISKISLTGKWIFEENHKGLRRFGDYFKVSNSIATLYNDAFVFEVKDEDDLFYYLDGGRIEKEIVYDAASIKSEKKYQNTQKRDKIIFPYKFVDKKVSSYEEGEFISKFPECYLYLKSHKDKLLKRKSSEGVQWFEYGRVQAINNIFVDKLIISAVITNNVQVYNVGCESVPYAGIYIRALQNSKLVLDEAKKILQSKMFYEYIKRCGTPTTTSSYRISVKDIENYYF